jgi:hypothetical protein
MVFFVIFNLVESSILIMLMVWLDVSELLRDEPYLKTHQALH